MNFLLYVVIFLVVLILILFFKNRANKQDAELWFDAYQNARKTLANNEAKKKKAIELSQMKKRAQDELEQERKRVEYKLALIENCELNAKDKFMGVHEFMIYDELIACEDIPDNFIICPQVPLVAFVSDNTEYSDDVDSRDRAWSTYSNLRVDFLFVLKFANKTTKPFAVLEFNGSGHYGDSEEVKEGVKNRDEIKKEAVLKAGLGFYVLGEEIYQTNKRYIDKGVLKTAILKIVAQLKRDYNSKIAN